MSHLISDSNVEANAAANSTSEVTDSLHATCPNTSAVDNSNLSEVDNAALSSARYIAEVNELDQSTLSGQQSLYFYWQLAYQYASTLLPRKGKN